MRLSRRKTPTYLALRAPVSKRGPLCTYAEITFIMLWLAVSPKWQGRAEHRILRFSILQFHSQTGVPFCRNGGPLLSHGTVARCPEFEPKAGIAISGGPAGAHNVISVEFRFAPQNVSFPQFAKTAFATKRPEKFGPRESFTRSSGMSATLTPYWRRAAA